MKLPSVPQGFTVKIASSSLPSVIQTDGTIVPPSKETTVILELEITRISDDTRALTVPLTVKVPASVSSPGGSDPGSGSNPGGNSGGNSGSSSGSSNNGGQSEGVSPGAGNAAPQPKPEKDRSVLELQAQPDQKGVVQSNVDASTIKDAFEVAPVTDVGKRLVELRLKPVSGATAYEVSLPASALIDQGESHVFNMVTELGMLELPASLLTKDIVGDGMASIRLVRTELPKTVADQLGTQYGVQLELQLDGQPWPLQSGFKLHLPFPSSQNVQQDRIVAFVIGENGVASPLPQSYYDPNSGQLVFSVTSLTGNYAVVSVEQAFADIAEVQWSKKAMEALAVRGVIDAEASGDSTRLHPKQEMTRGQYMQWLMTALGLNASSGNAFTDVNEKAPYYEAVTAARSLGITSGTGDGRFLPESTITRQEMMTLTVRALAAAGLVDAETAATDKLTRFRDASEIRSYARDSVALLVDLGIAHGYNGEVKPLDEATRAESAALLYAMMSKLVWNK